MKTITYPSWLTRELRSDHAGEIGAVWIYKGILSFSANSEIRTFARKHLATELKHLDRIESLLSLKHQSRLLPVWKIAGFITGALPALCGPQMTFSTIEAVENFVDQHYQNQIDRIRPALKQLPDLEIVHSVLSECQADEIIHRNEAAELAQNSRGVIVRFWCLLISKGSLAAVILARLI